MQAPSQKFASLDAVRGLAALLVFLFHFWSGFPDAPFPQILDLFGTAGHVGLDIFFVLSGFLIFRSLFLNGVNKEYFVRRFLRIAPIYYFSLFAVLIFIDRSYFFSAGGWQNIVSHLFFLQSFSEQTYYGINPVLWSLSVEWIFYLFLPLFFLLCGQSSRKMLWGIFLMMGVCWVYRFWITGYYGDWDSTQRIIYTENFIGRLDQFAFGMLASWSILKNDWKASWPGLFALALGLGGLFWSMELFAQFKSGFRDVMVLQVFLHSLTGVSAALVLWGLSLSGQGLSRVVGNPVLRFLGLISYSFYIWHLLVIEAVKKLTPHLDLHGQELLLTLFLTLGLSTFSYFLIERPFLRRKIYRQQP